MDWLLGAYNVADNQGQMLCQIDPQPRGKGVGVTLDLCCQGQFTLLTGIGGEGWVEAAKAYGAVNINTVVIGPGQDVEDIYQEWADIREVGEAGCLLVRPDGYIGWRSMDSAENATELLAAAMNQILAK